MWVGLEATNVPEILRFSEHCRIIVLSVPHKRIPISAKVMQMGALLRYLTKDI